MSETILKIFLEELETVRIVCRLNGCNTVIEVSIKNLATQKKLSCPLCNATLQDVHYDVLGALARSFNDIEKRKSDLGVEFIAKRPAP